MLRTLALSWGLVAFALSFSPAADAGTSCFGPDRFDGPCCSSATPFLPPFPAIIQTIKKLLGAWTDPSRYPGPQNLFVEQGTVRYVDGCLPGQTRIEYFKGVATSGGFPASNQQSLSLPAEFDDVGSANASPTNRTSVVGAPYVTFEILSLNL
ncbi:MAG: hypothetical protein HYR85_21045 [Planctomycetes bacterium]|nr:hypothetical protein [Planctomycetota bacterium]MBI3847032.1 hypothetical protein [Planctomycetota bacterium]